MAGFVLTLAAEQDVDEIWEYLAIEREAPQAAERVKSDLFQAFELLASTPRAGHRRGDLTDRRLLFWPVRKTYYVVYRADTQPVIIVRVLHGKRDLSRILAPDD